MWVSTVNLNVKLVGSMVFLTVIARRLTGALFTASVTSVEFAFGRGNLVTSSGAGPTPSQEGAELVIRPVYQHWLDACSAAGHQMGPFGPFSRPLPANFEAAVPDVEQVVEHILQGSPPKAILEAMHSRCKTFKVEGSRRAQREKKSQATEVKKGAFLQCFTQGQPRIYEDSVLYMYSVQLDNLMRRFGYINKTVLVKFSDSVRKEYLPALVKARKVESAEKATWPPEVLTWLNMGRHFGYRNFFEDLNGSMQFAWKKDVVMPEKKLKMKQRHHDVDPPHSVQAQLSDCQSFKDKAHGVAWRGAATGHPWEDSARFKLIRRWHGNTTHPEIDVGLSNYPADFPQEFKDTHKLADRIEVPNMTDKRYLLYVEGNDVASSGSWNLLSTSVVMMRKPTVESMALHGLLQPWVHYIPLKDDFSDLAERMEWCQNNLDECEDIAHRASLFMYHMWPGSMFANKVGEAVFEQYLKRYGHLVDCVCTAD